MRKYSAFNQSGYNGCLIKFKHNLIVSKEQGYIFFCFTGKNLADFIQGLTRDNNFLGFIGILQLNFPDRNAMSVEGKPPSAHRR